MSFEAYLQELADPKAALAVSKLARLAGMASDQAALFANVWLEMELHRRQRIIQEAIDLAEDNVELSFDALFLIALKDRDPGVRRSAIRGLWEYEGRDLIDSLLGLLETDADAGVRAEAALALGRFVLRAELQTLRPADAERVQRALARAFADEREVQEVRGRALESLGAAAEPWVRELIHEAIESGDRRLSLSAVHAMGRSCDVSWLPAVILELESDDAEMRFEAATAAGGIADQAAVPYLLPLLRDADAEVQQAAIAALGEIGGDEAKEALQELLDSDDAHLQEAVTAALAEIDFAEDPLAFKFSG